MTEPDNPPKWNPITKNPEENRPVWIITAHPQRIYPHLYKLHKGTVEYSKTDQSWRVSQGNEDGTVWCSWYPEGQKLLTNEVIITWIYSEDMDKSIHATK